MNFNPTGCGNDKLSLAIPVTPFIEGLTYMYIRVKPVLNIMYINKCSNKYRYFSL